MENKTSKYFKYAIGEILLVVIGIIIALQVNNWNEKRLQDDKTKVILNQIIDELIIDINVIQDANKYFVFKDSLIDAYRKVDLNKMQRNSDQEIDENDLVDMIRTFAPMDIHDQGFNLIMNQSDVLNPTYKPYIGELTFIYEDAKSMLDLYNQRLKTLLQDHRMHKIKNYAWYSGERGSYKIKQEEYEYYKYDPIYRNYVEFYQDMVYNIIISARIFQDRAIKFCRKVNADFNLNRDIDTKLFFSHPPKDILNAIKGKYINKDKDTLIFNEKDNQLYESTYDYKEFVYVMETRMKVGQLRYLGDSLFYRNPRYNLKLNADGTLSLESIIRGYHNILKRISND